MFYVGSYSKDDNTKAIYSVNIANNKLVSVNSIESGYNPSFLIDEDDSLLLLNEVENKDNLRIIEKNNSYRVFSSGGVGPCHLTRFGDYLAVSNYTSGSISLLKKCGNGFELCHVVGFEGSGPNRERQESSHVHSSIYDNSRKILYVIDLGCDTVTSFKVENDKLAVISQVKTEPGDGSRMMAINGNYGFVVNELSNTISVLLLDNNGGMEIVGRYNTLHEDCSVESYASHIAVEDNKLYISNRGYDSIVVFEIEGGKLTEPNWVKLKGSFPRHFVIEKHYLIVANQESNSVELYNINGDFIDSIEIYKPTVIVPLSFI